MKNNRPSRTLTRSRAAVLDILRGQPDPVGIDAVAQVADRHPNTVREHLNWLVARGLVRRHRVPGDGRGRPRWVYDAAGPRPAPDDHAEVAAELAWALSETGRDADLEEARERGRRWGHDRAGARRDTDRAAREATLALLDDLGFAPETDPDAATALLTRCPLLQAAFEFRTVVCSMHQGLVEGALVEHGTHADAVELEPFGHARGCPLRLGS